MRKSSWLVVLLLAAFLPGVFAGEKEDCTAAVEGFYKAYLADVNAFIERSDRKVKETPMNHWKPYFTPECWAAYVKLKKTPDLDYDPLLQSNNVPDAMKVMTAQVKGDSGQVKLKYVGYVDSTPLLEVRAKKVKGSWLVDSVGDLNK